MKQIKYPEITLNKEEIVRYQLEHILKECGLNTTDLTVLSNIFLYKNHAPAMMVNKGFSKSRKSIENLITGYRKKGLVVGTRKNTKLNDTLLKNLFLDDLEYTLTIKLNDTLDKEL